MKPRSIGVSDIREVNRKIVLRSIWKHQPISRAALSQFTRINKASISEIVAQLVRERLIVETPEITSGVGRNPIALQINPRRYAFYAIEIEVPQTVVAVYDLTGCRLALGRLKVHTLRSSPRRLIAAACHRLGALAAGCGVSASAVRAIGVCVPGTVDRTNGVVLWSAPLGWENVPLARIIGEIGGSQLAVRIDKTANSALRAELLKGGTLPDNVTGVFVEIGKEVDSAIILDGKILRGDPYGSGSFGRSLLFVRGGDPGTVPKTWQELVSLPALEGARESIAASGSRSSARRRVDGLDDIGACLSNLRERIVAGEKGAAETLRTEAEMLALGFANIFLSLGLRNLIIGGPIRAIWDLLEKAVREECSRLTRGRFPGTYTIRLLSVGDHECLEGAALDAIETVVPLELISELAVTQKEVIEEIAIETPLSSSVGRPARIH